MSHYYRSEYPWGYHTTGLLPGRGGKSRQDSADNAMEYAKITAMHFFVRPRFPVSLLR